MNRSASFERPPYGPINVTAFGYERQQTEEMRFRRVAYRRSTFLRTLRRFRSRSPFVTAGNFEEEDNRADVAYMFAISFMSGNLILQSFSIDRKFERFAN